MSSPPPEARGNWQPWDRNAAVPDDVVVRDPKRKCVCDGGDRDRGAASVLAIGIIAALVLLTAGAMTIASVVTASHQARLAADLAAIAAALQLQQGGSPGAACEHGAASARQNRARLAGCGVEGDSVAVTVEVAPARWPPAAVARARAGPAGG